MFTIDRMRAGYADYAGEYVNDDAVYYYYDDDDYEDDDTHCAAGVYVRTVLAPLSQGRTDAHIPPFVRSLFITSPPRVRHGAEGSPQIWSEKPAVESARA